MADGMMLGPVRPLCEHCSARSGSDPLTGLADRRQFLERLTAALADDGARQQRSIGVLLLDLDRFKAVNDVLGHPAGDQLLIAASRRLRTALRPDDLAARLDGAEFAVLLSQGDRAAAAAVAARLVDLLSRPYLLAGRAATVGASVGVVTAPADGSRPDQLLARAGLALYQAKAEGRGRVLWFTPELETRAEARRVLEAGLRAAVALGQLEVHYQPQLDLATNRLSGFEALVRWRHPERGLIPPSEFIPLAEELALLPSIGAWVLKAACIEAAGWPGAPSVAVNVGAQQFEDGRLPGMVAQALAGAGLPPDRLELEITETALFRDAESVLRQLSALQATGVAISLDDFGTGHSSLTQLRSFHFDRVKIDRSFADDVAVVRAVAALGTSLGMRTTAEGVETAAQLERLRADGCSDAQGYLLSRPVPAGDVVALIARLTPAAAPEEGEG